jgi:hypothetical protein
VEVCLAVSRRWLWTRDSAGERVGVLGFRPMAFEAPRLISRSCTSGWFDWVWGDLWLTEDVLVRLSRGMTETRRAARRRKGQGGGSTVTEMGAIDAMTPDALNDRLSADRRNRRALLGEIRTAKLHRGVLNSRLSLILHDGTRIKLLWLKDDPAHDILKEVLEDRLGADLKLS